MIGRVQRRLHRRRGHAIRHSRVTVPLFSPDRGDLYVCSCERVWAE